MYDYLPTFIQRAVDAVSPQQSEYNSADLIHPFTQQDLDRYRNSASPLHWMIIQQVATLQNFKGDINLNAPFNLYSRTSDLLFKVVSFINSTSPFPTVYGNDPCDNINKTDLLFLLIARQPDLLEALLEAKLRINPHYPFKLSTRNINHISTALLLSCSLEFDLLRLLSQSAACLEDEKLKWAYECDKINYMHDKSNIFLFFLIYNQFDLYDRFIEAFASCPLPLRQSLPVHVPFGARRQEMKSNVLGLLWSKQQYARLARLLDLMNWNFEQFHKAELYVSGVTIVLPDELATIAQCLIHPDCQLRQRETRYEQMILTERRHHLYGAVSEALKSGNYDTVSDLMERAKRIQERETSQQTAINPRSTSQARVINWCYPQQLASIPGHEAGDTVLHIVARRGNVTLLRKLLQWPGVVVSINNRRGQTAFEATHDGVCFYVLLKHINNSKDIPAYENLANRATQIRANWPAPAAPPVPLIPAVPAAPPSAARLPVPNQIIVPQPLPPEPLQVQLEKAVSYGNQAAACNLLQQNPALLVTEIAWFDRLYEKKYFQILDLALESLARTNNNDVALNYRALCLISIRNKSRLLEPFIAGTQAHWLNSDFSYLEKNSPLDLALQHQSFETADILLTTVLKRRIFGEQFYADCFKRVLDNEQSQPRGQWQILEEKLLEPMAEPPNNIIIAAIKCLAATAARWDKVKQIIEQRKANAEFMKDLKRAAARDKTILSPDLKHAYFPAPIVTSFMPSAAKPNIQTAVPAAPPAAAKLNVQTAVPAAPLPIPLPVRPPAVTSTTRVPPRAGQKPSKPDTPTVPAHTGRDTGKSSAAASGTQEQSWARVVAPLQMSSVPITSPLVEMPVPTAPAPAPAFVPDPDSLPIAAGPVGPSRPERLRSPSSLPSPSPPPSGSSSPRHLSISAAEIPKVPTRQPASSPQSGLLGIAPPTRSTVPTLPLLQPASPSPSPGIINWPWSKIPSPNGGIEEFHDNKMSSYEAVFILLKQLLYLFPSSQPLIYIRGGFPRDGVRDVIPKDADGATVIPPQKIQQELKDFQNKVTDKYIFVVDEKIKGIAGESWQSVGITCYVRGTDPLHFVMRFEITYYPHLNAEQLLTHVPIDLSCNQLFLCLLSMAADYLSLTSPPGTSVKEIMQAIRGHNKLSCLKLDDPLAVIRLFIRQYSINKLRKRIEPVALEALKDKAEKRIEPVPLSKVWARIEDPALEQAIQNPNFSFASKTSKQSYRQFFTALLNGIPHENFLALFKDMADMKLLEKFLPGFEAGITASFSYYGRSVSGTLQEYIEFCTNTIVWLYRQKDQLTKAGQLTHEHIGELFIAPIVAAGINKNFYAEQWKEVTVALIRGRQQVDSERYMYQRELKSNASFPWLADYYLSNRRTWQQNTALLEDSPLVYLTSISNTYFKAYQRFCGGEKTLWEKPFALWKSQALLL